MKPLVLVGAGDHGRGTLEILLERHKAQLPTPEIVAFVDDAEERQGTKVGGVEVVGGINWLIERADEYSALLAIASVDAKAAIAPRLNEAGVTWAQAVHPTVVLGRGTTLDDGAIVNAGVVIAYDTHVGKHTTINLSSTVGHDCVVGDFSTIAPGVNVTGHVVIGERCEVQTNATIAPKIRIGADARVGPGSVVLSDVQPGTSVFGNPARRMPVRGG